MITLTDTAAARSRTSSPPKANDDLALRVAVRPGGCSGFSYEMFFDTDVAADDITADYGGVKVVVDPSSAQLLDGRHARLQGRAAAGRLRHRQPERPAHLRLRPVLQLRIPLGRVGLSSAITGRPSPSCRIRSGR